MNIWDLHAGTLGFATVVLTSSNAITAFVVAGNAQAGARTAKSWGWTMATAAAAFFAWLVGAGWAHWLDFLVGNFMAVVFSVLFLRSLGLLVGRPVAPIWQALQFSIGVVGIMLVELAGAPRAVAVVSIAAAFLAAGAGGVALLANSREVRASNWGKTLLATLTVWCVTVIGARLLSLVFGAGDAAVRPLASSHVQAVALLTGILMLTIMGLGVIALLAEQQQRAALEHARRDGLTGMLTRAAFFEQASSQATGPFSIAMIDIDHFKRFNDHFGHPGGDAVLRHAAVQMLRWVRSVDIVGRYGGEEFCLLLPGCDGAEALKVAQRICGEAARHPARLPDGRSVPYSVSIGLATGRVTGEALASQAIERALSRADEALYRAKAAGRNQVQVFADTAPSAAPPPAKSLPVEAGRLARDPSP